MFKFNKDRRKEKLKELLTEARNEYAVDLIRRRFNESPTSDLETLEEAIKFFTNIHYWKSPREFKLPVTKKITDPIHGTFSVPDPVAYLLNVPFIQRMTYIKQLSFAYLIYPGAMHSRLEHSIGVSHKAGLFIDELRKKDINIW